MQAAMKAVLVVIGGHGKVSRDVAQDRWQVAPSRDIFNMDPPRPEVPPAKPPR
jgi:hypothetical protein